MVLTVHVRGYLENIPASISKLFSLGAYGVALYFIISGFLSYESVRKCLNFKQYFKKKVVRILPMYYMSLIATFVVGALLLKVYPIDWKWVYHVFFINMFVPSRDWMWWNSVNFFWTMPAFIAWYILAYFIAKKVSSSTSIVIGSVIISALTPGLKRIMLKFASEQFVNWNFFCLLYVFSFGLLAYLIIKEKKHIVGGIYGILIGVIGFAFGNKSGFFVFGLFFYFAIIFVDLCPIKWSNKKMNEAIRLLSAISYSTYLTHWFVLNLCGVWLSTMHWMIAYFVFIAVAALLGYFCYRFIEKPASKLIVNHYKM